MKEEEVIRALAALGQPQRLKIFRALVLGGREGRTPGMLVGSIAIPAATLSFHLKELVASGLVTQERASRNLIYRAAYDRVNSLLGYLTENCCEGEECLDLHPRTLSAQIGKAGIARRERIPSSES